MSNPTPLIDYNNLFGSIDKKRLVLGQIGPNTLNQHANTVARSELQQGPRQKRKREELDEPDLEKARLASKCNRLKAKLKEVQHTASEEALKSARLEEQLETSAREIAALQATIAAHKAKYRQLLADAAAKLEQQEARISSLSSSLEQTTNASTVDGPFSKFLQVETIASDDNKISWKLKLNMGRSELEFLLLPVPDSDLLEYRPVKISNIKKVPNYIQDAVFFNQAQLPVWLSKVLASLSLHSS
eukprot:TRINITY_DN16067_c0_g1_i1.p1 TRINITY_DN16067_c0_g1~~TRINITY_DN16067_c0_g1_i1.p1  ORF type:complete len:245 (+),score=48.97 TRINITY_DN16067_c0_g1_i1:126-860(+)